MKAGLPVIKGDVFAALPAAEQATSAATNKKATDKGVLRQSCVFSKVIVCGLMNNCTAVEKPGRPGKTSGKKV